MWYVCSQLFTIVLERVLKVKLFINVELQARVNAFSVSFLMIITRLRDL